MTEVDKEALRNKQFVDLFRDIQFIQPMYEGQWNIENKIPLLKDDENNSKERRTPNQVMS